MHHFFEAITNTAGDSLIGYFARVIDRTTQNTVTLSSDDNGTPIVTVSGVENMAKSDAYGNLSLYVTPGTYHLDIYAPNTTSFLYRVSDVAMNSTKGDKGDAGDTGDVGASDATFSTLTALKAINPATYPSPRLAAASGSSGGVVNGLFTYQTGNFTGRTDVVVLDTVPVTTGALVRQASDSVTYDTAQTVKKRMDLIVYTSDVRFKNDGTKVGGAKIDGNGVGGGTDDTVAIQGIYDWVAERGGGTVIHAIGTSKTTAPLNVPGTVSLDGYGIFSCINPVACDGLNLLASDEIGPRGFRNLNIRGFGSDEKSAILVDVTFPLRVQGPVIESNIISFFANGVKAKGLWHTTIRSNCFNQVVKGVFLYDRNVKVTVDDNRINRGNPAVGTGLSCGIHIGDDAALRPEDIQVTKNIAVGFQRGLYWRNCLFGSANNNDFDYCTESVIHVVTADGGTAFMQNWGQVDNTGAIVRGVYFEALGSVPGVGTITVRDNRMRATDVQIVAGQLLSFGADYANNQANIVSSGNSYEGAFQVGLRADGIRRCVIENEKTDAQVIVFNSRDSTIGNGNYFGGGLTLSGNIGLTFGTIRGAHTTRIETLVDIPANVTSVTVTFLSLNYPDLPLGGYQIVPQVTDYGMTAHDKPISVSPTRTGVTFNIPAPLGVPSTVALTLGIK